MTSGRKKPTPPSAGENRMPTTGAPVTPKKNASSTPAIASAPFAARNCVGVTR
jgi:hypothetical protein